MSAAMSPGLYTGSVYRSGPSLGTEAAVYGSDRLFCKSGTHDDSPVTVVAGVMATSRQWSDFQVGLARVRETYGFSVFHATDLAKRSGEFKGWTREKAASMANAVAALIADCMMDVVTVALNNEEYDVHYRGTETPRKLRLDTRYGLCFRMCLIHLALAAIQPPGAERKESDQIYVVLEHGHRHWKDAGRVFSEESEGLRNLLGSDLLGTITFAGKKDCDPIMIADFVAYAEWSRHKYPQIMESGDQEADTTFPPRTVPQNATVTYIDVGPGDMASYKAFMVERFHDARRRKLPTSFLPWFSRLPERR